MREKLHKLLVDLKFGGMNKSLDEELDRATGGQLPIEEVLHHLLCNESAHRQERALDYRVKQAKLRWPWSLETFPFEQQPGVSATQIRSLASLDFVQRAQNLVFIGPPGTGKTGLAIGLMRKALLEGYRGRFYNAQDLLDELYASLADRTTSRLLNRLANYDLLLIDELGYLSLKPEQANAFFKLMAMRYGRKSTMITSNLAYEEWYELFGRKALVDALLDRLRHQCITIHIKGASLRQPLQDDQETETT